MGESLTIEVDMGISKYRSWWESRNKDVYGRISKYWKFMWESLTKAIDVRISEYRNWCENLWILSTKKKFAGESLNIENDWS